MNYTAERFRDVVQVVFTDGVALDHFSSDELALAAQWAWEHDEGYVAFRIGLELGYRRGR